MIRQAIARGVLKSCERSASDCRETCIEELVDILSLILPKTKVKSDIRPSAVKFIEAAIQLKNQMTEEQAVYRCFMLAYGESVTNANLNIGDEEIVGGIVFLCTFPGLQRIVLDEEGKKEVLIVVKANGLLKGESLTPEGNEVSNEAESPSENATKGPENVD
jgi:hypothetical protein